MTFKYLFLFTISPVQSFISQARKTQDLYAGSTILCQLVKSAIDKGAELGLSMIFPIFPKEVSEGGSIPNRFVAKLNSDLTEKQLQDIGQAIEDAAINEFTSLAEKALNAAKLTDLEYQKIKSAFWNQINNHLDINWLFYPLADASDQSYREAYQNMEIEMASVKNMRIFNQNPEQGRKCSLDGERNALFFGEGTNKNYLTQGVIVNKGGFWLGKNEGLSAISFIKRGFEDTNNFSFPSTAEIALSSIIQKKGEKAIYDIFKGIISPQNFDAQLLFQENLNEKYLVKNGYANVLEKCPISVLKDLRNKAIGKDDIESEAYKYYAIVAFDGDKMGKLVGGDKSIFVGDNLEEYQGELSKSLTTFAKIVHTKFKENPIWGSIVYTGGDDFLGFLNLHTLFEALKWLRQEFHNKVNNPLKASGYFKDDFSFTFSAGVAIAHYKMPLGIVLGKARAMEKKAKDEGDRDAFAIAVLKHSGESHECCFKWNLAEAMSHLKAMESLVNHFHNDCSENFARNIGRQFYKLQDNKLRIHEAMFLLFDSELKRLINQSLTDNKKDKTNLILECVKKLIIIDKSNLKIDFLLFDNFFSTIKICLFLKRHTNNN